MTWNNSFLKCSSLRTKKINHLSGDVPDTGPYHEIGPGLDHGTGWRDQGHGRNQGRELLIESLTGWIGIKGTEKG